MRRLLKGGAFFVCEPAKRITVPVSLDFMAVPSCGMGTESSSKIRIVKDLDEEIEGKDVFAVRYGPDCAQKYRKLPYIGVIEAD